MMAVETDENTDKTDTNFTAEKLFGMHNKKTITQKNIMHRYFSVKKSEIEKNRL